MEKILKAAYDYGHFWNPSKPNVLNVDRSSLNKLTLDHPVAKEALQSWQEFDVNYDALFTLQKFQTSPYVGEGPGAFAEFTSREKIQVEYDGEYNVATDSLMRLARCPLPDYLPPEDTKVHVSSPGLKKAIETMRNFYRLRGTGTGSWPAPGCDPEVPASHKQYHSIVVQIDTSAAPARWKDPNYHKTALEAVRNGYAEIGLMVRYDLEKKFSKPHIAKRFAALWGSTIGWNEFPSPGTCNQTIGGRLDNGYVPTDWRLWANLEFHETGHGVGEGHTRGGPMNPSILLIWPLTWIGSPSEASVRRSFGGQRIPPILVPVGPEDFLGI